MKASGNFECPKCREKKLDKFIRWESRKEYGEEEKWIFKDGKFVYSSPDGGLEEEVPPIKRLQYVPLSYYDSIWNRCAGSTTEQWNNMAGKWRCWKCGFSTLSFLDFIPKKK